MERLRNGESPAHSDFHDVHHDICIYVPKGCQGDVSERFGRWLLSGAVFGDPSFKVLTTSGFGADRHSLPTPR